jgi:hypothetical protein
MGAQGTTTVDFGAYPGSDSTSVAVTGQAAILSGSLVEAWIFPAATADHTHDEHLVDPPRVIAGSVSAGTGFTIYAFSPHPAIPGGDAIDGSFHLTPRNDVRIWGKWNVAWVWN